MVNCNSKTAGWIKDPASLNLLPPPHPTSPTEYHLGISFGLEGSSLGKGVEKRALETGPPQRTSGTKWVTGLRAALSRPEAVRAPGGMRGGGGRRDAAVPGVGSSRSHPAVGALPARAPSAAPTRGARAGLPGLRRRRAGRPRARAGERAAGRGGRTREPSPPLTCRRCSPGAERAPALRPGPARGRASPAGPAPTCDPGSASGAAEEPSPRPGRAKVTPRCTRALWVPSRASSRPAAVPGHPSVRPCPHLHRARPPFVALRRLPRAHGAAGRYEGQPGTTFVLAGV